MVWQRILVEGESAVGGLWLQWWDVDGTDIGLERAGIGGLRFTCVLISIFVI